MSRKHKKTDQAIQDLEEKYKRALADYQNLQKRSLASQQQAILQSKINLISQFLPLLDDLETASKHIKNDGLQLVLENFYQLLNKLDVSTPQVEGKAFDPQTMECSELVSGKSNIVVSVDQKGYLLRDRLIRPAKVKVGRGQEKK